MPEPESKIGWKNHAYHAVLLVASFALCAYWLFCLPKSGKALLLLGGVAALMLLADLHPKLKAAYVVLIIGLIFIENHALDKERTDSAKEQAANRKEENAQFREIVDSLKDSIRLSQEQFSTTSSGLERSISAITGGKTFCLVKAVPTVDNQLAIVIGTRGISPLHTVHVQMIDVDLAKNRAPKGPLTSQDLIDFPEIPFLAQGAGSTVTFLPIDARDKRSITFNFFSLNGSWTEDLRLRRINGQWEQAMRILRVKTTDQPLIPLYEWASEHYPKVNGKVVWD